MTNQNITYDDKDLKRNVTERFYWHNRTSQVINIVAPESMREFLSVR